MDKLCKYVYDRDTTDRLRTRAILSHVYHHALHDNWFQARDLILMSHLQETIQHSDPSTQVQKNVIQICSIKIRNVQIIKICKGIY